MKVENTKLQLRKDNQEFFSESFVSDRDGEQGKPKEEQSMTPWVWRVQRPSSSV